MPLLQEIMGRDVAPAITRAENISSLQQRALQSSLSELNLTDPQGRLFLPKIRQLTAAQQSIVLHDYLKKEGVSDISESLLKRCTGLIHSITPSKINLPKNRFFRRKEQRLFVEPSHSNNELHSP